MKFTLPFGKLTIPVLNLDSHVEFGDFFKNFAPKNKVYFISIERGTLFPNK